MYAFSRGDFKKWRESLEKINPKDAKMYTRNEFESIQAEFKR